MSLPYYKRYPRDFIEGTIGMPLDLKGAYSLVLDLIYMQDGALPDDARYISGLLGCSIKKWNGIRQELLIKGKIYVSGEFLRNYRADNERETLRKYQENQAEKGRISSKINNITEATVKPARVKPEPEPDTKEAGASLEGRHRASRLPTDWEPSQADIGFALQTGWEMEHVRIEAAKFRDYWIAKPGKDGIKMDWPATWRNWVRRNLPSNRTTAPPWKKRTVNEAADDLLRELQNERSKVEGGSGVIELFPANGRRY